MPDRRFGRVELWTQFKEAIPPAQKGRSSVSGSGAENGIISKSIECAEGGPGARGIQAGERLREGEGTDSEDPLGNSAVGD